MGYTTSVSSTSRFSTRSTIRNFMHEGHHLTGTWAWIFYDGGRNHVYVSAAYHVHVFSLTSGAFLPLLQFRLLIVSPNRLVLSLIQNVGKLGTDPPSSVPRRSVHSNCRGCPTSQLYSMASGSANSGAWKQRKSFDQCRGRAYRFHQHSPPKRNHQSITHQRKWQRALRQPLGIGSGDADRDTVGLCKWWDGEPLVAEGYGRRVEDLHSGRIPTPLPLRQRHGHVPAGSGARRIGRLCRRRTHCCGRRNAL